MEVEVAQLRVAGVAKAVDHERRDADQRPGLHCQLVARGTQPDRQLAREDVEEVGVVAVDVQVRALAARAEPRPRRVQRVALAEDLDATVRRVADDLALTLRDHARPVHGRTLRRRRPPGARTV